METVLTTLWPSSSLRRNFPEERSAFVFALGRYDRSVGGTACSSGPTCNRISHYVLSLSAHARIGGCAWLSNQTTRPGEDALKETLVSATTPDQAVVHRSIQSSRPSRRRPTRRPRTSSFAFRVDLVPSTCLDRLWHGCAANAPACFCRSQPPRRAAARCFASLTHLNASLNSML